MACALHSQDIQKLPADPAIRSGVLPNGVTYFLTTNPLYKGMADFALVQKVGYETVPAEEGSRVISISQQALAAQPRLLSPSVQDFFTSHGVVPGLNGFVEVSENATVFRFNDMMVAESPQLLDSTLLVLMNMVERGVVSDDEFVKRWYGAPDHAIIISGDINTGSVLEKLRMLSYMVPSSESSPRQEYEWQEEDMSVSLNKDGSRDIVTVSVTWRLQRTLREYMNTVQPLVYERYMSEMGIIACDRIAKRLDRAGIAYTGISYDYQNSIRSLDDEKFQISLSVSPSAVDTAVNVLASVMSGIDNGDVSVDDMRRAESIFLERLPRNERMENSAYVDMCIASYIYNSSLASEKEVRQFHSSKNISDSEELSIFNSVVTASVDPERNTVLGLRGNISEVSSDGLKDAFLSAWSAAEPMPADTGRNDVALWGPGEKVKVSSSRKEHMSGGTIWKLSNGMRVIFKKMPTDNVVYYSLMLNGGYGNLSDIRTGDGAYMSDYLDFCTIGGVSADVFKDELRKKGMTMDFKVNVSNTTIKGIAPDDGLESLLKVLLTVLNDRSVDKDAFARYAANEKLRLELTRGSLQDRLGIIDGIIYPDYKYTSWRSAGRLDESLAERADAFVDNLASKMNDAILILTGDVDESMLKKVLSMYASGFKVTEGAFSRPIVRGQPISGEVLYTVQGEENSVDIAMSAPLSLTADNYYAAIMTAMALRKNVIQTVSGTGMTVDITHDFSKYPQERFSLVVSLKEASASGFAPGTSAEDPIEAMNAVRRNLKNLDSIEISVAELKSYKSLLKKLMGMRKDNPEWWLKFINMRYLDGKDFVTGCDAKIDAVSVDKVKFLLKSLADGARVEYVTSRR